MLLKGKKSEIQFVDNTSNRIYVQMCFLLQIAAFHSSFVQTNAIQIRLTIHKPQTLTSEMIWFWPLHHNPHLITQCSI